MASLSRFSVSLNSDLLARVDEYADNNGMTRSGLIGLALKQYLSASESMPAVTSILTKVSELCNSAGVLSDQELKDQITLLEYQRDQILNKNN